MTLVCHVVIIAAPRTNIYTHA